MLINIELLKFKAEANRVAVPQWSREQVERIDSLVECERAVLGQSVGSALARVQQADNPLHKQEYGRSLLKRMQDFIPEYASLLVLEEAANSRRFELEEQEGGYDAA